MEISLTNAFLLLVILIGISAFFSASEMALSSVSKTRMKSAAENDKRALKVLELLEDYDRTITTIVVLNNIINILIPTIATLIFMSIIPNPNTAVFVSTFVISLVLILFGEIVPKIYGREKCENHTLRFAKLFKACNKIFFPVAIFFLTISNITKKIFFKKNDDAPLVEIEDEILTMIEDSVEDGHLEESEEELIRNAIEFNDVRVEEILQPKRNMVMLNIALSNSEMYEIMKEQRYSRIPVYELDTDNIIGIISEREFLTEFIENRDFDPRSILREIIFIPDTMKASKLLPQLQKSHVHLAIVLDERATVQGLVTTEDILEELVGEIWDEHDEVIEEVTQIEEHKYLVSGEMSISDFNDLYDIIKDIESEQSEATIAGYIIELAECIPDVGQVYEDNKFTFKIVEKDGNKIEKILIEAKEDAAVE